LVALVISIISEYTG